MVHPPRLCRALVASALFVVALGWSAGDAGAHAIVKETTPAADATVAAAPGRVVMRFNEPVELAFGAIRVYDSDRKRVDEGDADHFGGADVVAVRLDRGLAAGTYTVTWRVVSADGHPIREAFVFHVGSPGARPEGVAEELLAGEARTGEVEGVLAGLARWVTFGSLLVLVGATTFPLLARRQTLLWSPALVRWSIAGVVAGTAAAYVLQGAVAADVPLGEALDISVWQEVARTRFGRVAMARLLLAAALASVVWSRRRPSVVAATLACALAVTPGLGGHAGATSPVVLNVAADAVHVVGAGVWLGGLLLVLGVARSRPGPDGGSERDDAGGAAAVVARFSDVAVVAIAAVVATGLLRSWIEVGGLGALGESYGLVLGAKVAAFLPVLAAGFVNSRLLKPRLADPSEGGDRAWRRLRRVVAAEVAVAAVVIGVTAVLVNLPPARVAAASGGPFAAATDLGAYHLHVTVEPNRVGENEVALAATTDAGTAAPVESMTVLFRMPDHEIGPLVAEAAEVGPGRFVVRGRQLSVAGRWVLEVVARTGRFDEERAEVTLRVS